MLYYGMKEERWDGGEVVTFHSISHKWVGGGYIRGVYYFQRILCISFFLPTLFGNMLPQCIFLDFSTFMYIFFKFDGL